MSIITARQAGVRHTAVQSWLAAVVCLLVSVAAGAAPLPSWRDTATRARLVDFVARVTDPAGADYVPPAERIAVFDNDGTLWLEQPMYVQLRFALDRVQALAPQHPEWRQDPLVSAAISGDLGQVAAAGTEGLVRLIMLSHAGMSTTEFAGIVTDWLATARHPGLGRPYTELVYQPMLELLGWLRANGFKTFIVSGGGIDFLRPWAEAVYGIPPEQVVGSSIRVQYDGSSQPPTLQRLPEIDFIDDKAGKPVGIHSHIGRRPILAVGNSDGDFEMLEWTTSGTGPRLGVLIHHDDARREFAYDRESAMGRLVRGLDEGPARGWLLVSMQRDWAGIFPAAGSAD